MKQHTQNFKEEIKLIGKQQDSQIIYGNTILTSEEINSVTPSYEGNLLKSIMKQLDIDSNENIPVGTEIALKYGLWVNGAYEYLDLGKYIVKEVEKQEDTGSYLITCYDALLKSMVDYESMGITYPISVKNYLKAICNHLGLVFNDTNFVNANRMINKELYLDDEGNTLDYTFRDVLDEIAQVTGGVICIDSNNQVEVRYINDTGDTIDEEYLKDINVNFGAKYGPVNSLVFSRAEADNVYLKDETSIANNGLCELKIVDNQILNWDDREDYLVELFEKINGISYFVNDFTSTGIVYYDILDKYNVKIGDNLYSCLMLNDEIEITQGLNELIHTDMPETSETDYKKADKTERKLKHASITVDKQKGEIELLVKEKVGIDEIITKINLSSEEAQILANKISLAGKIIDLTGDKIIIQSDNFSVDETGKVTATAGEIGGFTTTASEFNSDIYSEYDFTEEDLNKIKLYIQEETQLTPEEITVYDVYKDGIVDARDYMMIKNYIGTGISKSNPGKVTISNGDVFNIYTIKDGNGKDIVNLNAQECYIQRLRVGNIQSGVESIKPEANTPTSVNVEFSNEYSSPPVVVATPLTGVPGKEVTGVGVSDITTTGFRLIVTRTNAITTNVNWIAIG